MRGHVNKQKNIWYEFHLEDRIRADHPLRAIKKLADAELARINDRFNAAYSAFGAPSIPPETLIKATLLMALYSIRSERQLCEDIELNMLYRLFLDMKPDEKVFDHSTFAQNRDRFADNGLIQSFYDGTVAKAISGKAASDEHFSVDGTLIQSMASLKSFRPKDDPKDPPEGGGPAAPKTSEPARDNNGWADFKGQKRSNATHESKIDPEARLYRKGRGREAKLYHTAHVLMENRNGLMMAVEVGPADGHEERRATIRMLKHVKRRHHFLPKTIGQDAGYKGEGHAQDLGKLGIAQHIAGVKGRKPRGWTASQRCRKRIEQLFGWTKEVANAARTRFIGRWKTKLYLLAAGATYNLLRMANLGLKA